MKQYRVLVVDDSAFMRRAVSLLLEKDPQFSVVGIARNGEDAVEKVERLRPDLITLDIEMPVMNGLEALEKIMKQSPIPVVMLSSYTREGASETLKSLELGAVDFFLKDRLINGSNDETVCQEFLKRLKGIAESKLRYKSPKAVPKVSFINKGTNHKDLIIIGSSTGGPSALQAILPHFPKDYPIPIVVAQHMPAGFTKPLAERFNTLCQCRVKEAENGEIVGGGTIYIAPSGFQTKFEKKHDGNVYFKIDNEEIDQTLYKPSVDVTLGSAAPLYNERLLAIILTGMGVDGMRGTEDVKKYHGHVFVEAEESCVVYGMPRAVWEAGYADAQYLISDMFQEIMSFIQVH